MNVARHLRRLNHCNFQHVVFLPFQCSLTQERRNGGHLKIFMVIISQKLSHKKTLGESRTQMGTSPEAVATARLLQAPDGKWVLSLGRWKEREDLWTSWQHHKKGGGTQRGRLYVHQGRADPSNLPRVPYLSGTWTH